MRAVIAEGVGSAATRAARDTTAQRAEREGPALGTAKSLLLDVLGGSDDPIAGAWQPSPPELVEARGFDFDVDFDGDVNLNLVFGH